MRTRDPNVIQALYAAPRARVLDWVEADPSRLLGLFRHVVGVLNFLQLACLAGLFVLMLRGSVRDAVPFVVVGVFCFSPIANLISVWPGRDSADLGMVAAIFNLLLLVFVGLTLGLWEGRFGVMVTGCILGPQWLALLVQARVLGPALRARAGAFGPTLREMF